jgi:phosphoglycolate phosphatase
MKACFFDLDGTLTDARAGLHASFRAALAALGLRSLSDLELDRFLGAPLPEMFRFLKPGISQQEIEHGIDAFRVAYEGGGIRLNRLYPGVKEMLQTLKRKGIPVWIVTSKPQLYADEVIEDLGLSALVAGVVGAGLDEKDTKPELVRRALSEAGVAGEDVVMVGDRHYDIEGALQNGAMPVGALWGYGSIEELSSAGCTKFAKSASDFSRQFVDQATSLSGHSIPRAAAG